jgi:fatty acid desaturase
VATLTADHLTDEQLDALGAELDALRAEVVASLGERDARYIHKIIRTQRGLDAAARALLLFAKFPPAWIAGTAALSVAKILENMELGHNIMHGQWDWMRDPKIHSTTWEWDHASAAEGWKKSHNFEHHTFTNVLGKDRDLGYSIMRSSPDQPWHPAHLAQPVYNQLLALFFEWGVAFYDLEVDLVKDGKKSKADFARDLKRFWRKARRQLAKDYVLFPALSVVSGPQSVVASMAASFVANCVRNFWAHAVIFCGHFPEGVETFPEEQLEGETRGQWYVRQMLGSANLSGSPLLHTMTGNLSHQIEHHIFPDIPSNRYAEIAPRVREICERYGLSYTIGPLRKQYGNVLRKINRYALPRRAESTAARAKLAASFAALPVRSATADAPAHQQPVRLAG